HCPSGYPARLESINLNVVRTLKRIFPYPIAFSDHTPGWEMDVAAVAMGAHIVEKTITLDRTQQSCEHMMSLEPGEMARFVEIIREVEVALGSKRRILSPKERENREHVRRSAYLVRNVKVGDRVSREDFEFRRPGYGLKPHEYLSVIGMNYSRNLKKDHMLTFEDL
ncbi:MAG: N-acetylneuraminate synthase family protein, partial [Desulfobulbaceae bacterium]|nr:N-acetylneuraminate synthase family protein [Desulfobulbaceae bacterium]